MASATIVVAVMAFSMIPVVLVFIIMIAIYASRFKKASPDQAIVVYGKPGQRGQQYNIVTGGGVFIWPVVQSFEYLSIAARTQEFRARNVTTSKKGSGKNIDLIVVATTRVPPDNEKLLYKAAENILHKNDDERDDMTKMIIDGSLRTTCRNIKAKKFDKDPDGTAKVIRKDANKELNTIGMELTTFAIKEVIH